MHLCCDCMHAIRLSVRVHMMEVVRVVRLMLTSLGYQDVGFARVKRNICQSRE